MNGQKRIIIRCSLVNFAYTFLLASILFWFTFKAFIALKSSFYNYLNNEATLSLIWQFVVLIVLLFGTTYFIWFLINFIIMILRGDKIIIDPKQIIIEEDSHITHIPSKYISSIKFQKRLHKYFGVVDTLIIRINDSYPDKLRLTRIKVIPPKPQAYELKEHKGHFIIYIYFPIWTLRILNYNKNKLQAELNRIGIQFQNMPNSNNLPKKEINVQCVHCNKYFWIKEPYERGTSLIIECPYCKRLNMDAWCKKCNIKNMLVPVDRLPQNGALSRFFKNIITTDPVAVVDKPLEYKPEFWLCTQCNTRWPITERVYNNVIKGERIREEADIK